MPKKGGGKKKKKKQSGLPEKFWALMPAPGTFNWSAAPQCLNNLGFVCARFYPLLSQIGAERTFVAWAGNRGNGFHLTLLARMPTLSSMRYSCIARLLRNPEHSYVATPHRRHEPSQRAEEQSASSSDPE